MRHREGIPKKRKEKATQAVVAESASSCLPVSLNRELIMRHSSWGNCIHSCHSSTTFGFIPDDADDATEPEGPREAAENWIESRKSASMTRWLSLLIVHTSITHVEKMPIKVIALARWAVEFETLPRNSDGLCKVRGY